MPAIDGTNPINRPLSLDLEYKKIIIIFFFSKCKERLCFFEGKSYLVTTISQLN